MHALPTEPPERGSPSPSTEPLGLTDADGLLERAMQPIIESTLVHTLQSRQAEMVESFYPVIGRAVRRSVRESLKGLVRSIDSRLRQTFSLRSLALQFKARRLGIPVSELILRDSLSFRVEEVFLISRKSGLLIHHVGRENNADREQLVSGMLTAIQDFVADSFKSDSVSLPESEESRDEEFGSLDSFEVRDKAIWLMHGPIAYMAVVILGDPPLGRREHFNAVLEDLHERFRKALFEYDGDSTTLEDALPYLEECLIEEAAPAEEPNNRFFILAAGVVLSGLLLLGGLWWKQAVRHSKLVALFNSTAGFAVSKSDFSLRTVSMDILRDPDASEIPELLKSAFGKEPNVAIHEIPFVSPAPEMTLLRANKRFKDFTTPDDQVELHVVERRLFATGTASARWLAKANEETRYLGIEAFDTSGLKNRDLAVMSDIGDEIARLSITFLPNQWKVSPGEGMKWRLLAQSIHKLYQYGQDRGMSCHFTLYATPKERTTETMIDLALRRTRHARSKLIEQGVTSDAVSAGDLAPPAVLQWLDERGIRHDAGTIVAYPTYQLSHTH